MCSVLLDCLHWGHVQLSLASATASILYPTPTPDHSSQVHGWSVSYSFLPSPPCVLRTGTLP